MSEEIRFIDLFRGIGGFHLGLERSNKISGDKQLRIGSEEGSGISQPENSAEPNFSCVWSNDNDKYATQIYKKHWPETPEVTGDIREVNAADIPTHDLLCGGFPCQSFSVAGKRKGFEDTRGTLFFEICRIAEYHRPELLLLENVKGLLSAPLVDEAGDTIPGTHGKVFEKILKSLEELGYWWEYQVLNSKNYGVPQNRERVFIVGHLREGCTKPIFPITKDDQTSERKGVQTVRPLSAGGNSGGLHSDMTMIIDGYNVAERKDGLTGTIRTNEGSSSSSGTVLGVTLANFSRYKGVNRTPYKKGGVSWVLNAAGDQGVLENKIIRRLTPIECERLQGFPDNWTEGISNTQRYKCLGNAVTVNVIEFLGRRIKECLANASCV